jgi:hypothetical protein
VTEYCIPNDRCPTHSIEAPKQEEVLIPSKPSNSNMRKIMMIAACLLLIKKTKEEMKK